MFQNPFVIYQIDISRSYRKIFNSVTERTRVRRNNSQILMLQPVSKQKKHCFFSNAIKRVLKHVRF